MFAIVWDGEIARAINQEGNIIINHTNMDIIIKAKKNYLIWVQTLVPNHRAQIAEKKNKILVPLGSHLQCVFIDFVKKIKNVMTPMSFDNMEIASLEWLINHHSGVQV